MSPTSTDFRTLRAAILTAAIAFPLSACGAGEQEDSAAPPTDATVATSSAPPTPAGAPATEPVREGTDPSGAGIVSRSAAEAAALAAVGEGRVTWSGPEDDRGAAWEIEVTRPDGSEVDVLVAADGRVIKQVEKFGSGPAGSGPGTPPTGGAVVSLEEAERAALAAVGEGRVTWSGQEDERGAAWEIEVTRPDGSEIDVLVAADGSIVG